MHTQQNELLKLAAARVAEANTGLSNIDTAVLLVLMADISGDQETGESSTARSVPSIAAEIGLSEPQVQRALSKLRDISLIARKQFTKRAGESAITTVLPTAYACLGLVSPDGSRPNFKPLPAQVTELLCGQSWSVLVAVASAWEQGCGLTESIAGQWTGAGLVCLQKVLEDRRQALGLASVNQLESELQRHDREAAGLDEIATADGVVTVLASHVEMDGLQSIGGWSFAKAVLNRLSERNPHLVTKDRLRDLVAETAYARAALPFVREHAFEDAVRIMAKQLLRRWEKPRKIRDVWYRWADRVIHSPAMLVA